MNLFVDDICDSLVLDSGASFHTTSQRDLLENYVAGNRGNVYLADGEPSNNIRIRVVRSKMPNKSMWKIQKVRHMSGLMINLILVGQLDDEGHFAVFCNGGWKVM